MKGVVIIFKHHVKTKQKQKLNEIIQKISQKLNLINIATNVIRLDQVNFEV